MPNHRVKIGLVITRWRSRQWDKITDDWILYWKWSVL